jgi:hypothetical protein
MKKMIIVLVAAVSIFSCNQQEKSKFKNAVDYNDHIVGKQSDLRKRLMAFVDASATNLDSSEQMLDKNIIYLDTVIDDLKNMGSFKGDSTLRDAAIKSFKFYQSIFANEYKQLLKIRRENGVGSDEASAETNKIISDITNRERTLDENFQAAQKEFARKNKITLTPNKF